MRQLNILIFLLCTPWNFLLCQEIPFISKFFDESYYSLPGGVVKQEISTFNMVGKKFGDRDSLTRGKLKIIPLMSCVDSTANFFREDVLVKITKKGFWPLEYLPTASDSMNADLYYAKSHPFLGTNGDFPHTSIASIQVEVDGKNIVIPEHTFRLLLDPNFCLFFKEMGYREDYCFVYRSLDKRRIYVYMINGDSSATYEVTWVIEDGKFLRRILDRDLN